MDGKTAGVIYFLTNQSMPGQTKIGYTCGPVTDRARQLNTTSVPRPFHILAQFNVVDPKRCEAEVHVTLACYRQSTDREFFVGSPAELLIRAIPAIAPYLQSGRCDPPDDEVAVAESSFEPDADDVYFMRFLLHDGFEKNETMSATELSEYHMEYAPLELERKLMRLRDEGFLVRTNRSAAGWGKWQLSPKGFAFLMDNGHQMQDLIDEAKPRNVRARESAWEIPHAGTLMQFNDYFADA